MEHSSPGLEEIFDKKLKAYASLDYKELKNPVDYYQNSIFVKQLEQRALCTRDRASPTLFLPRGRSSSPTVLSNLNLNNPNLNNPSHRRVKPDPWALNLNATCDLNNADLGASHLSTSCNHTGAFNNVAPSGPTAVASCTRPSTPCDSSISPKRFGSPSLRSKVLANRDKESLMDEIIDLKKVLLDQSATLQRQKVLSSNLELENRKLEKELEEFAYQGNNTKGVSRPGLVSHDTRLRSKIQGLKSRVSQLEATCEVQQEELVLLRGDIRVTRTRELEAERDVFAEEIERLQNFARKLKVVQNRLFCENKQLWRYKDRTTQLEAATQRLENSSNDLQKSLEKANKEIHESSRRGNESLIRAKRAERQCLDLQEQLAILSKMVEKEKSEKLKLQQMIHVLQEEVQNVEASLSSKAKLQTSSNSDQNQCEENQSGIFAKTWGFLHGGTFHTSKSRELDTVECEKLLLGERPKTRGEQRAKLVGGDSLEGRRSRPRSPAKPTNKKAMETSRLPQVSTHNHALEGERRHSSGPKAHIQEGESHMVEKSTHADKPVQASRAIEDPRHLSPYKYPCEDLTQKANAANFDLSHNSQQPGRAVSKEGELDQSKDVVADLVEGMINIQECLHSGEKNSVGGVLQLQEHGSSNEEAEKGAQASTGGKVASNVLVPRLNLHQVGGHPHHVEENNSEESGNAHQSSATNSNLLSSSTLTALKQSHQKVIAWDDNIGGGQDQHDGLAPSHDQKLPIIEESSTNVNEA
ncbi:hypothetical protein GOP47_0016689 [Adiantum capillus-veneris]|uniref:Uncharacterized protein n=1 Tax=Adiantum capillus-veneris TaxID=13818 RepID=A0A9D4UI58_ADICA|nr:hypothetical protein GOP47_0016689 [Adiantum capillus-veneris]